VATRDEELTEGSGKLARREVRQIKFATLTLFKRNGVRLLPPQEISTPTSPAPSSRA